MPVPTGEASGATPALTPPRSPRHFLVKTGSAACGNSLDYNFAEGQTDGCIRQASTKSASISSAVSGSSSFSVPAHYRVLSATAHSTLGGTPVRSVSSCSGRSSVDKKAQEVENRNEERDVSCSIDGHHDSGWPVPEKVAAFSEPASVMIKTPETTSPKTPRTPGLGIDAKSGAGSIATQDLADSKSALAGSSPRSRIAAGERVTQGRNGSFGLDTQSRRQNTQKSHRKAPSLKVTDRQLSTTTSSDRHSDFSSRVTSPRVSSLLHQTSSISAASSGQTAVEDPPLSPSRSASTTADMDGPLQNERASANPKTKLGARLRDLGSRSPRRRLSGFGVNLKCKVGGRLVPLTFPKDIAEGLYRASLDEVEKVRSPPDDGLTCEYVYGFHGGCFRNVHAVTRAPGSSSSSSSSTSPTQFVYSASALGIVYDLETNKQEFFTGHTAEVSAVAYNDKARLCATGQRVGRDLPRICVWSVDDRKERLRLLGLNRSVDLLEFSSDGQWLFSVGTDRQDLWANTGSRSGMRRRTSADLSPRRAGSGADQPRSSIFLWDMRDALNMSAEAPVKEVEKPIKHLYFMDHTCVLIAHPSEATRLLCCSLAGIAFVYGRWEKVVEGTEPDVSRPFNNHSLLEEGSNITSASFSTKGDLAVVGTNMGSILVFARVAAVGEFSEKLSVVPGAAVYILEWTSEGQLVAGGTDCGLTLFCLDDEGMLHPTRRFALLTKGGIPMAPVSAHVSGSPDLGYRILAGTQRGELVHVTIHTDHELCVQVLHKSPPKEATSIAVHPLRKSVFVIGDAEGNLGFFDATHKALLETAPYACQGGVRCMSWGPLGELLACGLETGKLELVLTDGWKENDDTAFGVATFLSIMQVLPALANGEANAVADIDFSTTSEKGRRYLACGCRDGRIVVFEVTLASGQAGRAAGATIRRHRILSGNSSAVLFIQFNVDGTKVASNCRDGTHMCWDLQSGDKTSPCSTKWHCEGHPFRLTMAWETVGIWNNEKYSDSMAVVASSDMAGNVCVVGDDQGGIHLFRFPTPMSAAESTDYTGHCSRVTSLAWMADGRLLTLGASRADGVLQWKLDSAMCQSFGIELPSTWENAASPVPPTIQSESGVQHGDSYGQESQYHSRERASGIQENETCAGEANLHVADSEPSTVLPSPVSTCQKQIPSSNTIDGRRQVSTPSQQAQPASAGDSLLTTTSNLLLQPSTTKPLSSPINVSQGVDAASCASDRRLKDGRVSSPCRHVPVVSGQFAVTRSIRSSVSPPRRVSRPSDVSPHVVRFFSSTVCPALGVLRPSGSPPTSVQVMLQGAQAVQAAQSKSSISRAVSPQAPAKPLAFDGGLLSPSLGSGSTKAPSIRMHALEVPSGRWVASAFVYLYQPTFSLDNVVDYRVVAGPRGSLGVSEVFTPPPGWGVLRSATGLLLWLQLVSGSLVAEEAAAKLAEHRGQVLPALSFRLDFEAPSIARIVVSADMLGWTESCTPLQQDEGVLRPAQGRMLLIRLNNKFDHIIKDLLSRAKHRSSSLQQSSREIPTSWK